MINSQDQSGFFFPLTSILNTFSSLSKKITNQINIVHVLGWGEKMSVTFSRASGFKYSISNYRATVGLFEVEM